MDYSKPFNFIFEDQDWFKKIAIGGLVGIIPIVNFALLGYCMQIARNVAAGAEKPLPEWDNFGAYFVSGAKISIANLIYLLPGLIVYSFYLVDFFQFMSFFIQNTEAILDNPLLMAEMQRQTVGTVRLEIYIFAAWNVLTMLVLVPATIRFIVHDRFSVFWQFPTNFALAKHHWKLILILFLVGYIANMLANFGLGLCCIGYLFTKPLTSYIWAHFLGQSVNQVEPSLR
jgi:hypothetical protein